MKKSKLKLEDYGDVDVELLKEMVSQLKGEYVDLEDFGYWRNNRDTVVIKLPNEQVAKGLVMGSAFMPDEAMKKKNVVRMWWD
jgi:hypothetical protein